MSTRGKFIVVEGIEGSGKSTQLRLLASAVRDAGLPCVVTREPGGTALADKVRSILLDPHEEGMDPIAELFLYSASRRQHVVEVVKPTIERGVLLLSDRFTDATLAYQGYGRGLSLEMLDHVNRWATDSLAPDLTLIFDLEENVGIERARTRNEERGLHRESRLEGEDLQFHRRVREGYLALVRSAPERYAIIDATGTPAAVYERVAAAIGSRFPDLSDAVRSDVEQ